MTWKRPIFPRQLSKAFIVSGFSRLKKRELGNTVADICTQLYDMYRVIKLNKVEVRNLAPFRMINSFDKDKFEQLFSEAREIANNECAGLSEQCIQVRDQILEMEKNEEDEGAKKILLEISDQADLLGQALSVESIEAHIQETHDQHIAFLNEQLEKEFKRLKAGFVRIVEDIKKVIELQFDASSETAKIAGAITFGYIGIQATINHFSKYLEKGLGHIDIETYKKDMEPLTKFSGDKSLLTVDVDEDEFYERESKAIIGDSTSAEDVKKHCITLLQAVRTLPGKYKE